MMDTALRKRFELMSPNFNANLIGSSVRFARETPGDAFGAGDFGKEDADVRHDFHKCGALAPRNRSKNQNAQIATKERTKIPPHARNVDAKLVVMTVLRIEVALTSALAIRLGASHLRLVLLSDRDRKALSCVAP
jgi:hypothetical protein